MVCPRCITAVEQVLIEQGHQHTQTTLGQIKAKNDFTSTELAHFKQAIELLGFKLLDDKKDQITAQIKAVLIALVRQEDAFLSVPLSSYLSQHIQYDYNYLSSVFSFQVQTTIEQYFISLKIETVKELLDYGELSLKQIAFKLNYSSVAHLSKQFKKVTQQTVTQYKENPKGLRQQIDKI